MRNDDMHRVLFLRLLTRAMDRAFLAAEAVNRECPELEMTVYVDAENSDVEEANWYAMGATTIVVKLVHPGSPDDEDPTLVWLQADETAATMEAGLLSIARQLVLRVGVDRAAAREALRQAATDERAAADVGGSL